MKTKKTFLIGILFILLFLVLYGFVPVNKNDEFSEIMKIALRDSGNKLLLYNRDSTSLILPVLELKKNVYELSFENDLSIVPDTIVSVLRKSIQASGLVEDYRVAVLNCSNNEVVYSYEINNSNEKDIIPCLGRNLPLDCYTIRIHFLEDETYFVGRKSIPLYSLVLIGFMGFILLNIKEGKSEKILTGDSSYLKIGNYKFYSHRNTLVRDKTEIKLTAKECELMKIFSEHQNQIIKRTILVKKVWEDNGVIVGRSLDTYISKLRKKFKDDDSLNIINVHGVGYKLEVIQ